VGAGHTHLLVYRPREASGADLDALVASGWTDFWVYVVGPAAGALTGAVLYQLVRGDTPVSD